MMYCVAITPHKSHPTITVIDWTQRASPTADYVLVIDADMIMNRIMNPVKLGVEPGRCMQT